MRSISEWPEFPESSQFLFGEGNFPFRKEVDRHEEVIHLFSPLRSLPLPVFRAGGTPEPEEAPYEQEPLHQPNRDPPPLSSSSHLPPKEGKGKRT